jgi:hypothetical protein
MLSENQKREIASKNDKELDASFTSWEYEGKTYHNIGLLQMWVRGYTPYANRYEDPPVLIDELEEWLEAHNSAMVDFPVGPPAFQFPSKDVAELFRMEWHDKARARYPYEEVARFREEQDKYNLKGDTNV